MKRLPIDTIICGDNVEIMSGWPDGCIDLTVTSPPYDLVDYDENGNLITHSDKGLRNYNGYEWNFVKVARQLYRVTKKGGVVVWVVNDATVKGSETGSSFRQALYFMGLGFNMETMVYDAGNPGARGSHDFYWQQFEFMFVFTKGEPETVNRIRDHKNKLPNTKNSANRRKQDGHRGKERYMTPKYSVRGNIWAFANGGGGSTNDDYAFSHPALFPESLARDHILSWSKPGDIVLDPFVGSGTTPKMCVKTDRHFIGIDISPDYAELAERRVAAVKQQPKLFDWDLQPTSGITDPADYSRLFEPVNEEAA